MRMHNLNLLLVEDDEVDRMAVRRALRELAIDAAVVEAHDGQQALDIIAGSADTTPPPRPFIILLDLNMPKVDGIAFLRRLRQEEAYAEDRNTVVFVLTTSSSKTDIERAYEHGVAGYLVKSDYDECMGRIAALLSTYEAIVEFPCRND